jgi:hypothetical protein
MHKRHLRQGKSVSLCRSATVSDKKMHGEIISHPATGPSGRQEI